MKLAGTPKDFKEGKTCCMCYEKEGIYTLDELTESDNSVGVIEQANLLLKGPWGFKDTDKFCEECFWK